MKKLNLLIFIFCYSINSYSQNSTDSLKTNQNEVTADDPSQFMTRLEFFNELQHHKNENTDFYLNQTTLRTIVKIGKRFTTRVDIPFVYNDIKTNADYQQSGIGDISFRILGYRFFQSFTSAVTGSVEFSLNTASSPILGTGKNVIMPMATYTRKLSKPKMLIALTVQQANSISGDENREKISFSKVQVLMLNFWSRKFWTVLGPEWYFDYVKGGVSMNVRERFTYAPVQRINIWIQPGVGIFGDFAPRYQWNAEVGCRYFFLRNTLLKRK